MNTITLLQPGRIVFGGGCALECIPWLTERGVHRPLLVTSPSVLKQVGFLIDALRSAGCTVRETPLITREPTCLMFEKALSVARAEKVDAVLGIGGGSALDVAKLVAALAFGKQTIQQVFGINLLGERALPLVCLPTTAGTGSEVSPNAILLDEPAQSKKAVISPHLVPDAAFIDPLLTLSVPPAVTAATGLDALTHCIEAYANKHAHPAVDLYAREGIRLISTHLLRGVREPSNLEARSQLALGSLYGGLCLGPVNTAAVHALAYPLGSRFGIAHGLSNAVLLPHVLRFNLSHAPERYAEVAAALGVERNGSPALTGEHGVQRVVDLLAACAIPQRISDLGIPRSALPAMAQAAMQLTRLLKNNPRTLTEADAVEIYEASY
jgi:alcohol dehydrogenase